MRIRWILIVTLCSLSTGAVVAQQAEEPPELDTVLVIGEQPGPGLWKVSKGDHVLWVLAAHGPLPKDMKWRSSEIEARIAGSQEVLYGGGVGIGANIGLLRGLTLIPGALRATKLPDRQRLEDVLPAEARARWRALRDKYLGKDKDVERMRPAIALERLRSAALRQSGLSGGPNAYDVVGDLRKKHKVRRNQLPATRRTVRVENPRGMLREAARLETPDLPCFIEGLDRLEEELDVTRRRANAWARGDITTLRSLHRELDLQQSLEESCTSALMTSLTEGEGADAAHMKKMLADMQWHAQWARVEAEQAWLAAAAAALEKNVSTFAVLSLNEVLKSDGLIEKLRAAGYVVDDPG